MKFVEDDGMIDVRTRMRDHILPGMAAEEAAGAPVPTVELSIRDTGCGIPGKHLSRIFDPYFTTKQTGSGLGLAIARQVIEAHSGSIAVEKSEMGGACFTLILPFEPELND